MLDNIVFFGYKFLILNKLINNYLVDTYVVITNSVYVNNVLHSMITQCSVQFFYGGLLC